MPTRELTTKFADPYRQPEEEIIRQYHALKNSPNTEIVLNAVPYMTIILNDYLKEDPEADSVPFRWIKDRLEQEYKIKCRSISNFFIGILDDYELVGGNRNKAVKLKK